MARKSKKGRTAKIADSSPVLQPQENRGNPKPQTQAQGTKPQKKKSRSSAGNRKNKNKAATSPETTTAKLDPIHAPQAQDPEPGMTMPWDMDLKYNSAVDAGEISSVNDNSVLVQLLKISELGRMIIDLINPSIGDLTALAMSCKRVAACTRAKFDVWDSRSGVFPIDHYGEKDEQGRITQIGDFRANTLVITPTSDEPKVPKKPYETDFRNMMQLCNAVTQIPSTFRSIALDQLPFFDVGMFEMMVNTMPKLDTVTITRCLLLDITKLRPLLEVIDRHPRFLESRPSQNMSDNPWDAESNQDKPESKAHAQAQVQAQAQATSSQQNAKRKKYQQEMLRKQARQPSYIRLDFSPFFFHGPESGPRLGSYGVTYNEPTFNAPKAVFALIIQCRDLANKVGMDLLSDSSSFWGFVRRLPGPDALWAIKARETLITYEHELAVGKKPIKVIWDRFADDLTAALTGDNQAHPHIPSAMARYLPHGMSGTYWRESEKCLMCGSTFPVSLFPIRRDACWSCKMERYVETMEDSHLRLWQEAALRHWRAGLKRDEANFQTLISYRKPTLDKALEDVRCADWVRMYFLDFHPPPQNTAEYDWETGTPPEQLYCPPPPRDLEPTRASMARWRWDRAAATAAFDYRKGGPQRSHPCRVPISTGDYADYNYGPEAEVHFNSRWQWNRLSDKFYKEIVFEEQRAMDAKGGRRRLPPGITDEHHAFKQQLKEARKSTKYCKKVRDSERHAQNLRDKKLYTLQLHFVEDCLFSMSTLAHKPFNLDKPIPDPGVNPVEYNRLLDEHGRMSNYGFRKDGCWQ
ncbi:hypothetical protein CHGG_01913 [Chaetomium globosum CBS 148.51]|uniref:Uncharacterized protein n=1 Tax=Chaetomium globosum (strain ATCC 6205 / CBS 148.51 / DSM 1962 / NBRC 6347 / NRRL 1970) TaxID=306901 RepID=Q2HCZ1_CHAGB|nr:uncharacterized protein CHGG_01913 [Chaetomium globosum CBS 148.51]EAQ93678.1 hypothetical protein CHGG_01913 [Chaetomium globosum CBS 148.51]